MSLLVAAIFIPYVILMACLFAYICHTGRHHEDDGDDEPERALA